MNIIQIDLKTGKVLQQTNPETLVLEPKLKSVEHSYLETWLNHHGLNDSQFYVADFYDGVVDQDRQRLEEDGKILVFTNGKKGYFTDRDTAKLMTEGDRSIYATNDNSAHYGVAYGSLIASDGIASTLRSDCKILVVDDERRSAGIEIDDLDHLLNKMGDGTMLVSDAVIRSLLTEEDSNLDPNNLVTQFRAASLDFPGIAKGTLTHSQWCDYLGVDAIVSRSDIKGDDGRFSTIGIHEVETFWINRKADAEYGLQSVGPQVKGCIPEATLQEFNPMMKAKAEQLAAIATDPVALMKYYAEKKRDEILPEGESIEENADRPKTDWLKELAAADEHGQLAGFKRVNTELERFLKGERKDLALRGIEVPSATAQHHSALKPWEIANRNLPQGAIVAYYRSPFPNVGAAAIAINNIRSLRWKDPESYDKQGVIFLNPWTAKNIAITDFDGDRNGCFVGFTAADVEDPTGIGTKLPDYLRSQLAGLEEHPEAEQYEAARALIQEVITEQVWVKPADYPIAVTEIIEATAPDRRPPEINKTAKVNHDWNRAIDSHSGATWRAWEKTANNPIGKVANVGMTLQSLALETIYIRDDRKEALLEEISAHHRKIVNQLKDGKLVVSDQLSKDIKERVETIAAASNGLKKIQDKSDRLAFVSDRLTIVNRLLTEMVNGPNAMNLQTAVDAAKSSRGIDENVQAWMKALAHREHQTRKHQKEPDLYTHGKILPTNTEEPIGWAVNTANEIYVESALPELKHEVFRDLFPRQENPEIERQAMTIAHTYQAMVRETRLMDDRLRKRKPEDRQPTVTITTAKGNVIQIERMMDAKGQADSPIWRSDGLRENWVVEVERDRTGLQASIITPTGKQAIGWVNPESAEKSGLSQRLRNGTLRISSPTIALYPPLAIQHDLDDRLRDARVYLEETIAKIPETQRLAYASALWHHSDGMGVVLKGFMPEVTERLQQLPRLKLTGLQQDVNQVGTLAEGDYRIQFTTHSYVKNGEVRSVPAIALVDADSELTSFGVIDARSMRLPEGTIAIAHIAPEEKIAQVQVTEILNVQKNHDRFHPSRSELREWYLVADSEQKQVIEAIGRKLNDVYCAEMGFDKAEPGEAAIVPTPIDYRSDRVSLNKSEFEEMRRAIEEQRSGELIKKRELVR
jgi:hypothetical protein